MQETSKSAELRQFLGDFDRYLHGQGIDIGAGPDPLRIPNGSVRAWDLPDGDAQLMAGVSDNSYDFVYSSHCLEHLRSVEESLRNWIRILKPGGWLYIVVPDYILYEKMCWPSRFNPDHKQSFSFLVTRQAVQRDNHYNLQNDLIPLLQSLGQTEITWRLDDLHFNYNCALVDQTMLGALSQLCIISRKPAV